MKTSKQKCLEMWEWLAANPDKNKDDYNIMLQNQKRSYEFRPCWACAEAGLRLSNFSINNIITKADSCDFCPVWLGESNCCNVGDPYDNWLEAISPIKRKKYALQIVDMIKENWKD